MQIIPAIIPQSFHDLDVRVDEVKEFAKVIQVDVVDGIYAPKASWPYKIDNDPDFQKIKLEGQGLPGWQDLQYEIDLMVENPEDVWRDWAEAGASGIIIHFESTDDPGKIIKDLKDGPFLQTKIGSAIKPETDEKELLPYLEDINLVQFMGSQNIGHHGEVFDDRVLEKIKNLRALNPDITIGVDIGMNEKTIPLVREAGATRVAVGSALFESDDIKKTYEHLLEL